MSASRARPGTTVRPQLEPLEERCVPTAASIPASALRGLDPTTGIPKTIAKVIQIARTEARAILGGINQLQQLPPATNAPSLSGALVAQNLQVAQAELTAVNRYIRSLQRTHQSPAQAYLRLFQMEANIASTNADLQTFQLQEIINGQMGPFTVPRSF